MSTARYAALLTSVIRGSEHEMTIPRLAYSVDEAAAMIGVSRRSIYELFRSGQLGSVKIGARRLIRRTDLDAFLDQPEPAR